MCFKPILSPTAISHQWHLHAECALHLFEHNFLHLLFLFGINTEVEFVMHLQYHLRANAFELESVVDIDHRHLDDIGGSALMAFRSANPRTVALPELMSLRYLLRLNNVSTYSFCRAVSLAFSIYSFTFGNVSK